MREVTKASNPPEAEGYKILCVGEPGTGKSTQYSTLPGRKFMYCFDPNSKKSLLGDIDIVEFIPDITDLDISAKTLRAPEKQVTIDKPTLKDVEPKTFLEFEQDFSERWHDKFFDNYDWVGFDGLTTLSEIMMDRITYLARRPGKNPEQADYTAEMNMMKNVIRVLSSLPNIYCTSHIEMMRDEVSGRIYWQLVVTGKNRLRVPLRFTDVIGFESIAEPGKGIHYQVKLERDRDHPMVRSTMATAHGAVVDVTLNRNKPVVGQGLGGLLKWRK